MARILKATLAFAFAVLLFAVPAVADPSSEYGEVTRFGGFDSSAFNSGSYGGPLTPGKFLDPTGFAVDPQDNTVYVVDRTSIYKVNPTSWRIQQLSPAGAVTGTTTFTLPNSNFGASAIAGLAVDPRAGRLYALMMGSPPSSSPSKLVPVAQELLAWSTTPSLEGQLEAAKGLASDPLHTTGGLVSGVTQLRSGNTPLYGPQGIAIDQLESPGIDNPVAIEASDLQSQAGKPIPGDTIVQQVSTDGQQTGDLLASWSGASVAPELGASWGPLGISTNPDGTITALLEASNLSATNAYAVRLNADLTHPAVLNADAIEPPIVDLDQSPLWIDEAPFASVAGVAVSDTVGTGPGVIQLATTSSSHIGGPYAAVFFSANNLDAQIGPTAVPPSEYWASRETEANLGIRLLEPATNGTIVDRHGETITNTLGNGESGGACNIGAPQGALARGAAGTLWILDRGPKADIPGANGQGRQVIEFAPGAGHLCPQPSGTFTMDPNGGSIQSGEETLTISAGVRVTFDASSIDLQHGKPFAYEWDLDGNAANGTRHDGFETVNEMQPPNYYYPPSSITYTFEHPGRYLVRERVRSDYGAYTAPPATVIVTSPLHPEAHFTATSTAIGQQQVKFDTVGSTPGAGAIANYHWNWGDGSSEDDGPQAPVVEHTYGAPGSYAVTLTVTNSSYQSATSVSQIVIVQASSPVSTEPVEMLSGPPLALPLPIYQIPPAPPTDKAATRLVPRAHFARGTLGVGLMCPATKVLCVGTVRIETLTSLLARKHGHKHRASRLLLGQAHFTIAAGGHAMVSVHISALGKSLLMRVKHLKALVVVAAHDSFGDPGTAVAHLTLSVAATHRQR